MRLVVVCLLLLFSPTLAQASRVRLLTESISLEEAWLPSVASAPQRLTAPCLACHLASFANPPAKLTVQLPSSTAQVVRRAKAQPPSSRPRVIAIGDSWQLGHGREFSVRLTPTQEECAPLMRLKF